MTTQTLSRISSDSSQTTAKNRHNQPFGVKDRDNQMRKVRETYPVVQQVKYLHLQAEIDVLLQQLQTLKQN